VARARYDLAHNRVDPRKTPKKRHENLLITSRASLPQTLLAASTVCHIQDDPADMSSTIKRKLWSHFWDPASCLSPLKQYARSQKPPVPRPTTSYSSKRAFSWSRPRLQQPPTRRSVTKSFASCGFLFFDISPTVTSTSPAITSCATTAEKTLYTTSTLPRKLITSLAQQAWRRQIHSSCQMKQRGNARRNKSSASNGQKGRKPPQNGNSSSKVPPAAKKSEPVEPTPTSYLHLPHLPKMPHRPTKEELLAAATGFWSRLKVRFKWFSIRSVRPWNVDDWSAFISWFMLGNLVWILVGTTTFFSLVILSINTVVAQGMSHCGRISWTWQLIRHRNISTLGG